MIINCNLNNENMNFHDLSTSRTNLYDLQIVTMLIFWPCTAIEIINPNALPYMNLIAMMQNFVGAKDTKMTKVTI
jgi:hypothetical protein